MRQFLTIIIGFAHDFAAGGWAAVCLAIYWLEGQTGTPEQAAVAGGLQRQFFFAGLIALLVILASGAGRTFTYVNHVYGRENESRRRRLLLVKHLFLGLVFGLGTWWQYRVVFR